MTDQVRVLVVDDHEGFRDLMEITVSLEPGVVEVKTASHGREALELCQTFEPDVVFVDSLLPEMTGDEVSLRIKQLHPKARVISLSGQSEWEPEFADDKITKGGTGFLEEITRALGSDH
jgi:two-component system response regulator YesN